MELLHTEQISGEWHLAGQVWHESAGGKSNEQWLPWGMEEKEEREEEERGIPS